MRIKHENNGLDKQYLYIARELSRNIADKLKISGFPGARHNFMWTLG